MKIHFNPKAKATTSGVLEAACGQQARGRHSGGFLIASSTKSNVTCTKCQAL
ncbi:hypothetical protein SEA_JEMERALD_54 [Microbacterium phage Jemerald]|nr:hypothetical protein SEA_JUICER_54 [Microbacterium phage Juicer]WNO27293.1 hypothetical protein SEA_JEMERALD_54 [Microbacterium phage Jemerald]